MTTKQITKRLDERRGELNQTAARLNQIQQEQARLTTRARQLQGAVMEMEDMLEGPPLKAEDLKKAIEGAEAGET